MGETLSDARVASEGPRATVLHRDQEVSPTRNASKYAPQIKLMIYQKTGFVQEKNARGFFV